MKLNHIILTLAIMLVLAIPSIPITCGLDVGGITYLCRANTINVLSGGSVVTLDYEPYQLRQIAVIDSAGRIKIDQRYNMSKTVLNFNTNLTNIPSNTKGLVGNWSETKRNAGFYGFWVAQSSSLTLQYETAFTQDTNSTSANQTQNVTVPNIIAANIRGLTTNDSGIDQNPDDLFLMERGGTSLLLIHYNSNTNTFMGNCSYNETGASSIVGIEGVVNSSVIMLAGQGGKIRQVQFADKVGPAGGMCTVLANISINANSQPDGIADISYKPLWSTFQNNATAVDQRIDIGHTFLAANSANTAIYTFINNTALTGPIAFGTAMLNTSFPFLGQSIRVQGTANMSVCNNGTGQIIVNVTGQFIPNDTISSAVNGSNIFAGVGANFTSFNVTTTLSDSRYCSAQVQWAIQICDGSYVCSNTTANISQVYPAFNITNKAAGSTSSISCTGATRIDVLGSGFVNATIFTLSNMTGTLVECPYIITGTALTTSNVSNTLCRFDLIGVNLTANGSAAYIGLAYTNSNVGGTGVALIIGGTLLGAGGVYLLKKRLNKT